MKPYEHQQPINTHTEGLLYSATRCSVQVPCCVVSLGPHPFFNDVSYALFYPTLCMWIICSFKFQRKKGTTYSVLTSQVSTLPFTLVKIWTQMNCVSNFLHFNCVLTFLNNLKLILTVCIFFPKFPRLQSEVKAFVFSGFRLERMLVR